MSPPPTTTIFPDEPVAVDPVIVPVSSTMDPADLHPVPLTPKADLRPPSSPSLSPIGSPQANAFLSESFTRARSRAYSPMIDKNAPSWISAENYRPAASPSEVPSKTVMPLQTQYSLGLPLLPPDTAFTKRHKGRKPKQDSEMYKTYLSSKLNPLSDNLRTSAKVVLTQDWNVAMSELRHIRAMERIEQKANEGRWSLRQPRKVRGPPIPKAHWDYLLEEMVRLF